MQSLSPITIVKASGTKEPFSEEKLVRSLSKSGVSPDTASHTIDYLKSHLKPDMTTESIFSHVSEYLQKNASTENYRNYILKRAVMSLGPSGYPFEVLVSDLLRLDNYYTEVGVVTQGKCITHEIDIIAQKGAEKYFIECKYHNTAGYKSDVQVALYTYARFMDLESIQKENNPTLNNHSWLITNTKVTSEVIDYCKCVGILVTAMTYPAEGGLLDMIVSSGLHPVTILTHLPQNIIEALLKKEIVTCKRLKTAILNKEVTDLFGRQEEDIILKDIISICKENE